MKKLSFIGCGKAGRVLGRLWHDAGVFEISEVVTGSLKTASEAITGVGAGRPIASLDALGPADFLLIATPDQHIFSVAKKLAELQILDTNTIVFHLSGAAPSSVLRDAGLNNALVASMHPLRSFGDFTQSVAEFTGTWCGFEGDTGAKDQLDRAFAQIGGKTFEIDSDAKLVYHAACLMMSNFLNGLVDAGLDCFGEAGIDRQTALDLSAPILQNTLSNILAKGPVDALTGPISRGDADVVSAELMALSGKNPRLAELYRNLSSATLHTAMRGGHLDDSHVAKLKQILTRS